MHLSISKWSSILICTAEDTEIVSENYIQPTPSEYNSFMDCSESNLDTKLTVLQTFATQDDSKKKNVLSVLHDQSATEEI